MIKTQNPKQYDLGEGTLKFSKRASESRYWLFISEPINDKKKEKEELIQEATELMKIFGSIVEKSK